MAKKRKWKQPRKGTHLVGHTRNALQSARRLNVETYGVVCFLSSFDSNLTIYEGSNFCWKTDREKARPSLLALCFKHRIEVCCEIRWEWISGVFSRSTIRGRTRFPARGFDPFYLEEHEGCRAIMVTFANKIIMEMINKFYRTITGNLGFLDRVAFEESFCFVPNDCTVSLLMGKNASGECKLRHTNAYMIYQTRWKMLRYCTTWIFYSGSSNRKKYYKK